MAKQLQTHGYFSCTINDTYTYTSWAWQFIDALKEEIIYPRWTPLNFWGYGSPTFILYPPLSFYLVAFFNVFTSSVITAMNITKFLSLFISASGMFFLVREFYSERIALLSASFYIFFPFTILNMYLFGGFASTISFMWFSPILLFLYRYLEKRQYKYIFYAGACYGGLILTHLINAYMFTFVILIFVIYMSIVKRRKKDLIVIPFMTVIGLLVSAAYILPLVYERQFLNIEAFIGEGGGFHFGDFFILPNLTTKQLPDHFWPVYYNIFVFYVFFFIVLLLLFSYQSIKLRHDITMENAKVVNHFFIGITVVSIFLLFGISTSLWETIPFFKYIQFPARWLNIAAYAVIFLSAVNFLSLDIIYKTKKRHTITVLLFLVFFLLDFRYINSAPIFTEQELIPVKSINSTIEHLPAWVDVNKIDQNDNSQEKVVIKEGEGKTKIIAWKSAERLIEITSQNPLTLKIHTFNFPGWKGYIDGVQTEIKTNDGDGTIVINIPGGRHILKLIFEDTPIRYYSKHISVFLVITIFAIFIKDPSFVIYRRKKSQLL